MISAFTKMLVGAITVGGLLRRDRAKPAAAPAAGTGPPIFAPEEVAQFYREGPPEGYVHSTAPCARKR